MSPASSLYRLAGDVKEPTNFSQRVGKVARGVVVRLYFEKFLNLGHLQLSKRCDPPNAVWLKVPEKYCKLKKEICQECPKLASTIQNPKLANRVQNPQSATRVQNPKSATSVQNQPLVPKMQNSPQVSKSVPYKCPKFKNRPLVSKIKNWLTESKIK